MKFGVRKPSFKKSIKARTSGRAKRAVKKSVNPLYGKKGMGFVNNPKKAVYDKVYSKTTVDSLKSFKKSTNKSSSHKNKGETSQSKVSHKRMNNNSKQSSSILSGLGCLSIIGIIISFANPILFIITIPLFIYAKRSTNKQPTTNKKKKSNDSFELQPEITVTNNATTPAEADNEINIEYSTEFDHLLIGEIILLNWIDAKETTITPPKYFSYTYGINYNNSIQKLSKMGYIRYGTPSESLQSLKVVQLKDILSRNNLKVSGRKAKLISRIQEELSETEYENDVSDVRIVTSTGEEILDKYDLLVWGHKNGSKDNVVNPATLLPYLNDSRPHQEIALEISELEFRRNIQNLYYGLAINNLQYQSTLKEEMKLYNEALDLVLGATILELTGIGNTGDNDIYFFRGAVFIDTLKSKIIKYQDLLALNTDEIIEQANRIYEIYEPQLSDVKLFKNKEEFLLAVNIMTNGTKKDMDDLINNWFERVPQDYIL